MAKKIKISPLKDSATGVQIFVGDQRISDKIDGYSLTHFAGELPYLTVSMAHLPMDTIEYENANVKLESDQVDVIANIISKEQLDRLNRLWKAFNGGKE